MVNEASKDPKVEVTPILSNNVVSLVSVNGITSIDPRQSIRIYKVWFPSGVYLTEEGKRYDLKSGDFIEARKEDLIFYSQIYVDKERKTVVDHYVLKKHDILNRVTVKVNGASQPTQKEKK